MPKIPFFVIVFAALAYGSLAEAGPPECGSETAPCQVGELSYRVILPEHPENAPFVIYLHGYAATADAAAGRPDLAPVFADLGIAFVAPSGQPDISNPKALDWGVHDGHQWPRDDLTALNAIKQDAVARFGFDPDRLLLAGYSRGGSMVWDKACADPGFAFAYASASGAFWEPMWQTCRGPVHLHHSHGFSDRTVPLEGRLATFHGLEFEQGNVLKSIALITRANGCGQMANQVSTDAQIWEKRWTKCANGSVVLDLGPNGHSRQAGWADRVAGWFLGLAEMP